MNRTVAMHQGREFSATRRRSRALAGCVIASLIAAPSAPGQMDHPSVQAGDATFEINGNTYTVRQLTDRAIIEWDRFSIDLGDLLRFDQPGATSAVLNRVVGGDPSMLLGDLRANGRVYLLNPNGVLIGPDSVIRTQSFIASSLDVTNSAFMAGGDMTFTGGSTTPVINHGQIKAIGGDVFLIAHQVENHGVIKARSGTAGLAAGNEVLLKQAGDQRLFVRAGSGASNTGVDNSGGIVAAHAELAAAGGNVYALAINQQGVIRANGVDHRNGRILLTAEGRVRNGGRLKAPGGDVRVLGDAVTIASSSVIDVRVDFGDAGQVLIGGDYLGGNPDVHNAEETLVDFGAKILADGSEHGDGGRVIVWADGRTRFGGRIRTRGGTLGGDGGFVEVSGKNQLVYRGTVDTRAPVGAAGTLLLDPDTITIADGDGPSAGQGTWDNDGGPDITIYEVDLENAVGNVVLNAAEDIIINDLTDGELTLQADSARFLSNNEAALTNVGGFLMLDTTDTLRMTSAGASIEIQGGNIASGARPRNASMEIGNIVTNGGDVILTLKRQNPATPIYVQNITTNGGSLTVDRLDGNNSNNVDFVSEGLLDTSGGDIDITLVGSIDIDGGINVGAGTLSFSGTNTNLNSAVTATGDVTIDSVLNFGAGASISTDGAITFTDTANMNAGGSLTLSGSDFDFQDTFSGNNGTLTLQPNTVGGNMSIDATTFGNLDGFATVTMGRADGTGTATLSGNISITDPFVVIMGGVGGTINQTGTISGAGDASVTYIAGGTIDVDDTIDVPDGISFVAPAVDLAAALDAGAGDLTITADTLAYTTTLTGTGGITIQPYDNATTVGLGNGAAGALNLDQADLDNLANFSSYTFGSATGTGAVDVRAYTFDADLTIRSAGAGGTITLNDALGTSGGGVTLLAGSSVTLDTGSSITTQGGAVAVTAGSYFETAAGTSVATNGGDFTAVMDSIDAARALRGSIGTGAGDISITATSASQLLLRGAALTTTTGDIDLTVGTGAATGSTLGLFNGSALTTQDGAVTLTNTDTNGWIRIGDAGEGAGTIDATGSGVINIVNDGRTYVRNGGRIETDGGRITLDTDGLTVGDVGIGNVIATGGAVLIDSTDTVAFGATGLVTADDLGVIADAATTIRAQVSNIAVQKTGSGALTITNSGALTVADLSALDASLDETDISADADSSVTASSPITFAVDTTSDVGSGNTITWTSTDSGGGAADDNITINTGVTVSETSGSLTFDSGDAFVMNGSASATAAEALTINADDGASQAAAGTLVADGLLLTGSGDFDLQGTANDVNTIAGDLAGGLTYVDADGFSIGAVDGTNGLTSTATIALTAGGAVTQTEAVTANELSLIGGVDYTLDDSGNDVNTIAGVLDDLVFTDADGFAIGSIGGTAGIAASGDVTLTAAAAVTQSAAITAVDLALLGGVDYTLGHAGNDVDVIAGVIDDLIFTDSDAFVIGSAGGANGIGASGDVTFTAGGAVTQTQAIAADGLALLGGVDYTLSDAGNDVNTLVGSTNDLVFTDTDGFAVGSVNGTTGLTAVNAATLTAGGSVTQTEALTATDLALLGGVDYTLDHSGNDVDTLAAVVDALSFSDSDTLTIGTIGGTVGLTATDDVTLTAANNLIFDDDVTVNSGSAASLTARADGNITVSNNVTLRGAGSAVDITLNADRDGSAAGAIHLTSGASIDSAGGEIVLGGGADPLTNAAVGTAGHGIRLDNADLDSGGGDITLLGDSSSAADNEYGVFLAGSTLSAGGGTITITGANTGAGDSRIGTYLDSSALATSGSGQILLTGSGADGGTGSAAGIFSDSTTYQAANGSIVFSGAGGAAPGTSNIGIQLTNGSDITTTGVGAVSLNGTGGGQVGGFANHGVQLSSSDVTAAGGNVTLNGTDGFSDDVNDSAGAWIDASVIRSSTGDLAFEAAASSGAASTGIRLQNNAVIGGAADPGTVTLTADAMDLSTTGDVVIQGAGDLRIRPQSSSTSIGIGDGATGGLHLSAQELDALQDGFTSITVGRSGLSGAMHVTDAVFTDPLTLRTGGPLTLSGALNGSDRITLRAGTIAQTGGAITGPELEVRSFGAVDLGGSNDLDTVAIDAEGDVVFRDLDGVIIGAVGATSGWRADGDIVLTAGGAVSQTEAVRADGLALLGSVAYTLNHADNDLTTIAADALSLSFFDRDGLTVGDVGAVSGIAMTGSLTLSTGSDLIIVSAVSADTSEFMFGAAGGSLFDLDAPVTGSATVTGGAGDDTMRIGTWSADYTVDGGGGSNALHIDDRSETTGHTYTVTANTARRQSVARTIDYTNIALLQLSAGSGDDVVRSMFLAEIAQILDGGGGTNRLEFDPRPAALFSEQSPLIASGFGDVIHRNFAFTIIPLMFESASGDGSAYFLSDRTGRDRLAQRSESGVRDSGYDAVRAAAGVEPSSGSSIAEEVVRPRTAGRLLYRRGRLVYRFGEAQRTALIGLSSHDLFSTDETQRVVGAQ